MKTFIARLIFRIANNQSQSAEFDEQVRLISSHDMEDALLKARAIGRSEEETFLNPAGKLVSWQFVDVRDLYPLEGLQNKDLLFSSTIQVEDPAEFVSYIRNRSMEIQAKTLTFA